MVMYKFKCQHIVVVKLQHAFSLVDKELHSVFCQYVLYHSIIQTFHLHFICNQ